MEGKEHWSPGTGTERKCRRRHSEGSWKQGRPASGSYLQVATLALQVQNLVSSLDTVTLSQPDSEGGPVASG